MRIIIMAMATLRQENTHYSKRTHSIVREHILYNMRIIITATLRQKHWDKVEETAGSLVCMEGRWDGERAGGICNELQVCIL